MKEWTKLLKKKGLNAHGEIVAWLKKEHGVTHGYANLISQDFRNPPSEAGSSDDLVDAQYAGAKAQLRPIYERLADLYEGPLADAGAKAVLRPIYDALVEKVGRFGEDVEISPKKSYVSLRRSKQFALIQPSTKTRVDVGIQLPDTKPTKRLEKSGSFNSMVSHRVRLESPKDVDGELIGWLREAYDCA